MLRMQGDPVVDIVGPHILTHVPVDIGVPVCIDTDVEVCVVRAWSWWQERAKRLVSL